MADVIFTVAITVQDIDVDKIATYNGWDGMGNASDSLADSIKESNVNFIAREKLKTLNDDRDDDYVTHKNLVEGDISVVVT